MKLNIPPGTWPPGGWQYFDPKTNYRETKPTEHDRNEAAEAILAMRKNNKHIYRGNDLTFASALESLEAFTAKRLEYKGLKQFLLPDQPVQQSTPLVKKKASVQGQVAKVAEEKRHNFVERIKRIASGSQTLKDWIGEGHNPVSFELAEARSSLCVSCPLNDSGPDLLAKITSAVSEAIHKQMELKQHLNLRTTNDAKLGTCSACLCPLKLKVWSPLEFIEDNMDQSVAMELDPSCWILSEMKNADERRPK